MKALLTSCNRYDLLTQTLDSLLYKQREKLDIVVNEDSIDPEYSQSKLGATYGCTVIHTNGMGQHASIEAFLRNTRDKYYLHLENDWKFDNKYNWIHASLEIMRRDPKIVKVLCREGSPHPVTHNLDLGNGILYGYLEPWKSDDGTVWSGFSWNPGVTDASILRRMIPFPKFEQQLAERIWKFGYKVVEMKPAIYTHLGEGRSTVDLDPAKK